jgi:hypothetical protein
MRLTAASVIAALGIALCAADVRAQGEINGAIAGTARDTTGSVLPGVNVEVSSPALIEKTRTTVTDVQGQYRVVDLRPGMYSVTFTLSGFSTLQRTGITLTTGFTATVNAELGVGAVAETIVVSGESPMVDVQSVRTQTVVSRQVLDTLPTAKDLAGYAIATPGADGGTPARGVGGTKGEGNYALAFHGAAGGHTMQDGMMVESPIGAGTGRGYFSSQALVQEVVLYATGSAETEAGGLNVNVVTKDGGNKFNGVGNVAYANTSLQSDNLTDALRTARGVGTPNKVNEVYDFGAGVGGPIKRDAVWFYGAARRWGAEERVAGLYYNKLPAGSLFYEPDTDKPAVAPNKYYDTSVKITGKIGNHKLTASNSQQYKCNCFIFLGTANSLVASAVNTPEATSHSTAPWKTSFVRSATWSFPASNRLLFEAGWGQRRQDTYYRRPDEVSATARPVADIGLGLAYGAKIYGPSSWLVEQGRGIQVRHATRFAMSYVTGSHAFKAGYTHAFGSITINAQPNYPVQYVLRNRVPDSLNQIAAPHTQLDKLRNQDALFAQDQWTLRRLTLNLGLRFDYHNAYAPAQVLPPTPFTDSFAFDRKDNLPNWKDISPRIGASYDLFGNARSALKFSINRYVTPDSLTLSQSVNPANAISASTSRTWNDSTFGPGDPRSGNFVPDCDLRSPLLNGECGPMLNQRFGTQIPTTQYAPDVLDGWGVRPYTWQIAAALQQELRSNLSVTAGYYRTWQKNFRVTDNTLVSPSDYDQFCVTVPTDARLPGGGGNQLCGLYDLNLSKVGQVNNVVSQASNFGDYTQVFNGVDLTMNARFAGSGLLSGGVAFGRTSTNDCNARPDGVPVTTPAPAMPERAFCDRTNPWTNETFVRVAGAYPLPYGILASATFQNLPGILYQANVNYTNAQIAQSLGRNLSACGAAATCTTTRTITVTQAGLLSESRQSQFDVRVAKAFPFGRVRVKPLVDVYNVFNANTVLSDNNTFNALWPRPITLLGGRLFKFGADIDF